MMGVLQHVLGASSFVTEYAYVGQNVAKCRYRGPQGGVPSGGVQNAIVRYITKTLKKIHLGLAKLGF